MARSAYWASTDIISFLLFHESYTNTNLVFVDVILVFIGSPLITNERRLQYCLPMRVKRKLSRVSEIKYIPFLCSSNATQIMLFTCEGKQTFFL